MADHRIWIDPAELWRPVVWRSIYWNISRDDSQVRLLRRLVREFEDKGDLAEDVEESNSKASSEDGDRLVNSDRE